MTSLPDHVLRYGERWRAPYAADPRNSRGRLFPEPDSGLRSPFQRDRDRIVHSNAFRRLKHKTQVFVHHEGDHFRTRLTHTIEVAQIARSLARPMGLDEDLAEALALSHDLGHTPFGHAGERALDRSLAAFEGFDHNAQSLRIVTQLERRYPLFDGLNLSWETLEGLVKHNGPLLGPHGRHRGEAELPYAIRAYQSRHDLDLASCSSLEAQVAAISDDIAYDSHDVEDGLRAGLLSLGELDGWPVTGRILAAIAREYPGLEPARTTHELIRRMITVMIEDVIAETGRRIADAGIASLEDVRAAGRTLVGFSVGMAAAEAELKTCLYRELYRSSEVMRPVPLAEALVADLFERFHAEPELMPEDWSRNLDGDGFRTARRVADYIAGMTDRYAVAEHRRLFDETPDLG
ncbi:dGTPase [Faunimonas pinastri]|uniref:Deoxyguanosinetriphosphate triphosphohydrolase-like protein n=1 Tax=Faunimonas pinastri TaxID=1855383 RepID=A0A1H9CUV7_9HYPH|nr:deoxyguanosinetriphosphate triphosphohydrolase [Faunimonas pinastri]SEQ04358.1 dGTPase [Faunimonas pinastri]